MGGRSSGSGFKAGSPTAAATGETKSAVQRFVDAAMTAEFRHAPDAARGGATTLILEPDRTAGVVAGGWRAEVDSYRPTPRSMIRSRVRFFRGEVPAGEEEFRDSMTAMSEARRGILVRAAMRGDIPADMVPAPPRGLSRRRAGR